MGYRVIIFGVIRMAIKNHKIAVEFRAIHEGPKEILFLDHSRIFGVCSRAKKNNKKRVTFLVAIFLQLGCADEFSTLDLTADSETLRDGPRAEKVRARRK